LAQDDLCITTDWFKTVEREKEAFVMRNRFIQTLFILAMLATGFGLGRVSRPALETAAASPAAGRVFEIRTYTAAEGKLSALHARFRDHTTKLFSKHGMTNIGYWSPQDAPQSQNTLIYVIAHESREAAKKNWDSFRNDPEWQKVKKESEANGPLVTKLESVYMDATDYSPMK
jgi:hypothetical protein